MSSGANKIEITQSTLLKLLVRRGSNEERKNIILSEGELGYAVDTKKLFIGDGATVGGIPVTTQVFYGAVSPTTYNVATVGDFAYDSTEGALYALTGADPTNINSWGIVANDVRVDDATMQLITYNGVPNTLAVKTVSAAQLDPNLPGTGLEYNGAPVRTIQTTANQSFDSISIRSATALQMPNTLQFGTVGGATQYNLPSFDGVNGYSLVTNGNGVLDWKPGNSITQFLVLSGNQVPVGTILQYGSGGNFAQTVSSFNIPYGYMMCNGRTLSGTSYPALCNAIGTFYGTTTAAGTFKIPSLTASNYVFLIKYLEDQYLPAVTISLENSLTGLNVTSSASVTSFDVIQNTPTEFRIGVPDYVSKTYVDSNLTKVKRLITMSEPNCSNGYNSASYTMFIDSQDRVRFAGFNGRGVAGLGPPSWDGSGNYSEINSYINLPVLWDASSNEYEKAVDVYGAECTTFVLTNSGRVWSGGDNYYGCLGRGVIGVPDNGLYGLINIPAAAGKVTKISIGGGWWGSGSSYGARHVFALTDSGSAFGWGYNNFGQLGIGNTTNTATPICVNTGELLNKSIKKIYSFCGFAYGYSFAIDANDNVYSTGWNGFGALGLGNTTSRTSWKQLTAFTADEIYGAAAGDSQAAQSTFLLSGGKLWGAGYNGAYNLGLNNIANRTTFVPVCASSTLSTQLTGVSSLSISDTTDSTMVVYALMQDSTLRAWGRNAEGQCGIGSFTPYVSAPTSAFNTGSNFSNSNITKVRAAGIGTSSGVLALDSTGTLWFTGYNGAANKDSFAGIGVYGANLNAFTRVATPYGIKYKDFMLFKSSTNKSAFTGYSVLATDTKNNLYGWGNNDVSQLSIEEVGSYDANLLPFVYMPVQLKI